MHGAVVMEENSKYCGTISSFVMAALFFCPASITHAPCVRCLIDVHLI